MSRTMKFVCLFSVVLALAAGRAWSHDDPKKPAHGAQPSEADMMKMMMEMATPGPVHKTLGSLVGSWNFENKFTMAPGAPEQTSKGTCTNQTVLGGRYLASEIKGDMMGMPFEGSGMLGYDNSKNKAVLTWCDTMSTGIMYAEGESKNDGKWMEFKTDVDMGPMGKVPVRMVYTIDSADKYVFEWFETHDGKENKTMTITYTRAK